MSKKQMTIKQRKVRALFEEDVPDNSYIIDKVSEINSYFGFPFYELGEISIKTFIEEKVIKYMSSILPIEYRIKYKDQDVYGRICNISKKDLYRIRCQIPKEIFDTSDWENILYDISDNLLYCEESNHIYKVPLYLKNIIDQLDVSETVIGMLLGDILIPDVAGETIQIYEKYILKEKSISSKKHFITSMSDNLDIGLDLDDELWAFKYLEHTIIKPPVGMVTNLKEKDVIAKYNNITANDFIYRLSIGMPRQEAIELGVKERKSIGVSYSNNKLDNFIACIKHVAKQRGLNGYN